MGPGNASRRVAILNRCREHATALDALDTALAEPALKDERVRRLLTLRGLNGVLGPVRKQPLSLMRGMA